MAHIKKKTPQITAYNDQIRQALNHFQDPAWLEEQSPLAAPYFLGTANTAETTFAGYGQMLQEALITAANALWPGEIPRDRESLLASVDEDRLAQGHKGPRYLFLLLELRYFRRYFNSQMRPHADNDIAVCDFLSISRASYFNHLKAAQAALGDKLLDIVRPTLRLERPLQFTGELIGRTDLIAQCLIDLQLGRTVAFSGSGGVGKTTLAATIAHRWPQPVFWYTLRAQFNDRLDCLLFSLGYFLHRQGVSGLWQQLIADGGRIENPDMVLAQTRGDLQQLSAPPLICIDEMDVIDTDADQQTTNQLQIREFIDGLRQVTPLLLVAQRPVPLADAHYALKGLTLPETVTFLTATDISAPPPVLSRLHEYTGGNPRLLNLCVVLNHAGMSLADISSQLPHIPASQALWSRLWQRLADDERFLLQRLCVFRGPAPMDAWGTADVLARLLQQQLIQQDGVGGIFLLPIIRDLLYSDGHRFPVQAREESHLIAAEVRATRGEFTAAAYHFHEAGEAKAAVRVWFPQRQREIGHGYASMALLLFQQISGRYLDRREKEALALIQAELFQLHGDAEAGLVAVQNVTWPRSSETAVRAALLEGEFLNALGYPHRALKRYEDGVTVTTGLINQLVHFHYQRGVAYIQQRNLDDAWREAQLAQYEAAHLQAIVQEESGAYEEAIVFFERALQFATEAGYEQGIARTHRELSKTWGRMAQLEKALHHGEEAIRFFAHVGDRLSLEKMNSSLAAHYFQAGHFEEAVRVAEPTVAFFQEAGIPYWTAVTASTLAEAYYETGNLEAATATAYKVLRLEETHTQPYAYYTLGLVARATEAWEQSETYFHHSQQIASENGDRYMEAYAWRALGEVLLAQEKFAQGRESIETALQQFTALNLTQEVEMTRRIML